MATRTGLLMTPTSLTEEANNIKEIFLAKMQEEGHITKEKRDKMNEYCVVISEKNFFGRVWDKILWKNDPKAMNITVVKVVG